LDKNQCHQLDLGHYREVSDDEIQARKKEILAFFNTPDPKSDPLTRKLTEEDLTMAARTAIALDRFIQDFPLDGLRSRLLGPGGVIELDIEPIKAIRGGGV